MYLHMPEQITFPNGVLTNLRKKKGKTKTIVPLSHDSLPQRNFQFHFSYQMLISRLSLAVMPNDQLLGGVCINCVYACVC